jgi:hypothetical protein
MEHYKPPKGYDFLLDQDLQGFKDRVKMVLGIDCNIEAGTGKVQDYRGCFGLLYAKELEGYDFWGFTDLDCVYTDFPEETMTDELLSKYDVISNHNTYVCGPWTLLRNTPEVNNLFRHYTKWQDKLLGPQNGWIEEEYSRCLEASGIPYLYMFNQGNPWTDNPNLEKIDGRLYQDGKEIFMFHFRHSKRWPL